MSWAISITLTTLRCSKEKNLIMTLRSHTEMCVFFDETALEYYDTALRSSANVPHTNHSLDYSKSNTNKTRLGKMYSSIPTKL